MAKFSQNGDITTRGEYVSSYKKGDTFSVFNVIGKLLHGVIETGESMGTVAYIAPENVYFGYGVALELMKNGCELSAVYGQHDYYVMKEDVIYGMASCDYGLYPLKEDELNTLRETDWYFISDRWYPENYEIVEEGV